MAPHDLYAHRKRRFNADSNCASLCVQATANIELKRFETYVQKYFYLNETDIEARFSMFNEVIVDQKKILNHIFLEYVN